MYSPISELYNMIIHHHLGLGDHFVCNGLVNYLSRKQSVHLICKQHNKPTVSSLYSENDNVTIIPIQGNNELLESYNYSQQNKLPILYVGFNKCDPQNWDQSFYKQLNINFLERYRFFKLPRKLPPQISIPNEKFIFVHNTSSDGQFVLNIESPLHQFIASKNDGNNLLSYIQIIQEAEEIHCINSSLFHLIDSLPCVTNKLYYHNVRPHPCNFQISYKWEIVNNYDN